MVVIFTCQAQAQAQENLSIDKKCQYHGENPSHRLAFDHTTEAWEGELMLVVKYMHIYIF